MLRDYQQKSIDMLYKWFADNKTGNPCLVMPTGSGKSHIVAALCKDAVQQWPETRVLMLTHVKELIEQNYEKMLQHWPDAPVGIYSASVGQRDLSKNITFAGIQSIRNKAIECGHIDIVIIDECFTGDTMVSTPVGHKRIDKVCNGDIVYNAIGTGAVEAVSVRKSQTIYKVRLSNGIEIKTTNAHPFFTAKGWVNAENLEQGDCLFSVQDMRRMWRDDSAKNTRRWQSPGEKVIRDDAVLLNILLEEKRKFDVDSWGERKDVSNIKEDWTQAFACRGERERDDCAASYDVKNFGGWVGARIGDPDKNSKKTKAISNLLQGRYREQRYDGGYRYRWEEPLREKGCIRSKERRFSEVIRVESVTVEKQGGDINVYNLQISGHPSYFANGVLVHNCHLVSHKAEGGYRTLIDRLTTINPALRVVGLTATPYRLGHGMITDKPAIFDALIEPVTIDELVAAGYLAKLKSKATQIRLEVSGVKKRGGEYIESELQQCVDTESNNSAVVREIIDVGISRRHWLIFCAGVDHAMHVRDKLVEYGITAECITGETPKKERERIIQQYKAGEIIALTNANVLTTGFDYPDIDLIAMLRPTLSPGLYVQMAGRGLRVKSDGGDCYVLDFAGNVATHGAITDITPPKKGGKGEGDAPVRVCPECQEILHISVKTCPECGYVFPAPEPKKMVLRDDDIMGKSGIKMEVTDWRWNKHIGRASNVEMINVSYYSGLSSHVVREYICINHGGYAGQKAVQTIMNIAQHCGIITQNFSEMDDTIIDICDMFNAANPPAEIEYKKDGNFYKILERSWRV